MRKRGMLVAVAAMAMAMSVNAQKAYEGTKFFDNWYVGLNGGGITPTSHSAFWKNMGSVTILGDLTIHANNFATLNKKNFTSVTPLKLALNFLILALNDSAFALVSLSSKKLRILS